VTYALLAISYLIGATPTSYWAGRLFHGIDLREHGSGNLGATNAFRVLGWRSDPEVVLGDVDVLVLTSLHEGLPRRRLQAVWEPQQEPGRWEIGKLPDLGQVLLERC